MDAFLKLPETLPLDRVSRAVLRLLGEDDWALE